MSEKLGGKSANAGVGEKFPAFPTTRKADGHGKVPDTGKVPQPSVKGGGKNSSLTGQG